MRRKEHKIYSSKSSRRPTSIIFFDTETRQTIQASGETIHTLRLGHAKHYRKRDDDNLRYQSEISFTTQDEFIDYLLTRCYPKSTVVVTAHNVVFDMTICNLFTILPNLGWELRSFYTKGIVSMFRWKKDTSKIEFIDNTNLFPGTLRRWGKIVGLPKLDVNFDDVPDDELLTYCKRDVDIMVKCWQTWLKFLDDNDCGQFKPTLASTAFSTWSHRFMPYVPYIHTVDDVNELEREAYHGGRCECFYQGKVDKGNFYYLDINNMYGYVLKKYLYPQSFIRMSWDMSIEMLVRKLGSYAVVSRVQVNTDRPFLPLKLDGHMTYPVGRFITTLTTPELCYALQNGYIEKVFTTAWYRQAPLFSSYIDYFYQLRYTYKKDGNDGYSEICKLLINSLYGKFGQRGINQKMIGKCDPEEISSTSVFDVDKKEHYRIISVAGSVFEERKEGESYNSFPAIAAHVTAYARMYLWYLIIKVPRHHVYYCDTDSLIVDEEGYKSLCGLINPATIGMLKVELKSSNIEIRSPKDYSMGERNRVKGVRENAEKLDIATFSQDQWAHLASLIGSGDMSSYTTKKVIKHLSRKITSGIVDPDGWISPFVLGEADHVLPEVPSQSETVKLKRIE